MKNIGIIILAAGSSSRMGRPKQLLPLNGQPLLLYTVEEALSTPALHVMVVLGSNLETHSELLETYPVHIVNNEDWDRGIGSSIKKGLSTLQEKTKDLDAVLFMTGDQPAITFEYLTRIMNTYHASDAPVIASGYSGTFGVPVLFSRELFNEILALEDAQGAKSILTKREKDLFVLDCPEGAMDLDTPEDYIRFKDQFLFKNSNSL